MNAPLVQAHWKCFKRGLQQPSLCIQHCPLVSEFTHSGSCGFKISQTEGRNKSELTKASVDTPYHRVMGYLGKSQSSQLF